MRLGIFYPPTCVGLRYGLLSIHRIFSRHRLWQYGSAKSLTSEFNHLVASINASIRVKGRKCRNINLLSIAYAYPPRLRSRLTPGRKTWPGNPWVYGGRGFHPPYRYSCLHPLFSTLHGQSPSRFDALRMLLYRTIPQGMAPRASVSCLIANHFRRRISR